MDVPGATKLHAEELEAFADFRVQAWSHGLPSNPDELQPLYPTVLHALAAAAHSGSEVGITLLGEREGDPAVHRSYGEIYRAARGYAGALASRGVTKGDRVLMVMPTSHEFVATFYATQMLGAIPVPVYPPAGRRFEAGLARLVGIANHADTSVCITIKRVRPFIGDVALRSSVRAIVNAEDLDGEPLDLAFEPKPSDIAFIQYTSGSTGNPKGAQITHGNLVANIHSSGLGLRVTGDDVWVSWCPLYHDMGLVGGLLLTPYWQVSLVLMSPTAFLTNPARWLWAIHEYKGTVSPAPNFAYDLCVKRVKPEQREGLDLSSWRAALNGAEQVNARTVSDFEHTYAPHGLRPEAMLPVYGLAEATLAVTFPALHERARFDRISTEALSRGRAVAPRDGGDAVDVACVGKAIPGQLARVVDDDGNPVDERSVGNVVVASRSLMQGYLEAEDATRSALRDGWLWTGDLGYVADGDLFITGRAKDVIIVNGRNYYPDDIERAAESVDGVRAGCTVAFGVYDAERAAERVAVVCETRVTGDDERAELEDRIRDRLAEACEVAVHDVVLVGPGTIPKTSSGKRQRSRCRQLLLDDALRAPHLGKIGMLWLMARSRLGLVAVALKRLFGRSHRTEAPLLPEAA